MNMHLRMNKGDLVSYHEPPSKAMYGANSNNFEWAQRDTVVNITYLYAIAGRGPWFWGRRSQSPEPNLVHS